MSAAAEGLLDRLDAEGRAHIPIPRRLGPHELAAALMAVSRAAMEINEARPGEIYMAVVRGSRIRKPTAEWVWVFWTDDGAQQLEEAARRELGL
jgi:hypothetical protein